MHGVSGHIEFNSHGYRDNLSLAVVDLSNDDKIDLVGFWHEKRSNKKLEIIRSFAKEMDRISSRLNRNLNVTTKIEAPYVMVFIRYLCYGNYEVVFVIRNFHRVYDDYAYIIIMAYR